VGKWKKKTGAAFWAIAEFIGVKQDTVSSWFYRKKKPDVYRKISLAFFFEQFGYRVVELVRLKQFYPHSYLLTEMLGYGLITSEEARKQLGLADIAVMLLLAGGRNTSEKRIEIIQELHAQRAVNLEEAKRRLADLVADFRKKSVNLPKRRRAMPPIPIKTLAAQLTATLEFLEEHPQYGCELRGLAWEDLHRLSKAADGLCDVLEREMVVNRQVARIA
jgi:polyhydroxyalkanoate synthesis regulator phasin